MVTVRRGSTLIPFDMIFSRKHLLIHDCTLVNALKGELIVTVNVTKKKTSAELLLF